MAAGSGEELGLRFDLDPIRKGVRAAAEVVRLGFAGAMKPFDRDVEKSAKKAKKQTDGFVDGFKSKLAGIGAAIAAAFAFREVLSYIREGISLADELADNFDKVGAALEGMTEKQRGGKSVNDLLKSIREGTKNNRLALGIGEADQAQGIQNYLTMGFDPKQAQQFVLIAAGLAQKSGKEFSAVLEDVAKAATGTVKPLKAYGINLEASGDKLKDAQAAVAAMAKSAGLAADLVDPWDLLDANLKALQITVGEGIVPVFADWTAWLNDLLVGLTQTEEGKKQLDEFFATLRTGADTVAIVGGALGNFWTIFRATVTGQVEMVKEWVGNFFDFVLAKLNGLPAVLKKALGIDQHALDLMIKTNRDITKDAADQRKQATKEIFDATGRLFTGQNSALGENLNSIAKKGSAINEAARKKVAEDLATVQRDAGGFVPPPAENADSGGSKKGKGKKGPAFAFPSKYTNPDAFRDGTKITVGVQVKNLQPTRFGRSPNG